MKVYGYGHKKYVLSYYDNNRVFEENVSPSFDSKSATTEKWRDIHRSTPDDPYKSLR